MDNIANEALQLAERNQQELVSIEENSETLKRDKILEEVKDSITRNFEEQTEDMRNHMNKLKDENEDWRNL